MHMEFYIHFVHEKYLAQAGSDSLLLRDVQTPPELPLKGVLSYKENGNTL